MMLLRAVVVSSSQPNLILTQAYMLWAVTFAKSYYQRLASITMAITEAFAS